MDKFHNVKNVNVDRIKEFAKSKGITMKFLCDCLGKRRTFLTDVRRGVDHIDENELSIIADKLNTTVEYLTGTQGRTAVRGYCLRDQVSPVDYVPSVPYLCYEVDVTFRTEADAGLPAGFITEYTVGAPFYGTFRFGSSTYYYVELNGAFGYVPATACSLLDYPLNTEHTEVAAPETQPEAQEQPQAGGGLSVAAIVLLCVLGAAGLGLLYFLFRPAHKKRVHEEEAEEFYG